jgi:DNA replication protein DnaC
MSDFSGVTDIRALVARAQQAQGECEARDDGSARRLLDERVDRLVRARGCLPEHPATRAALLRLLATDGHEGAVDGHQGSAESMRGCRLLDGLEAILVALVGPTGVGKTWASYWLAARVPGSLLVWASDVQVGRAWDDLRERAMSADTRLVVVNDLTERAMRTAWRAEHVADVIERRHDIGRRTLVTANLDGAEVEAALGDRVASRLAEGVVIECVGDDLRRR